ncbi:MAG: hypothetical protein J6A75_04215 [Lachnospiraceae bacterium]|nr:hypothetical protein [Lachnospiraceae bacterium]
MAKENEYAMQVKDVLEDYMQKKELSYTFSEEYGLFYFYVSLSENAIKKIDYFLYITESDFIVYAIMPIGVDASDAQAMHKAAEFICRANHGLIFGNFELDYDKGEIRYKYPVECFGKMPSLSTFERSIVIPLKMVDGYSVELLKVIYLNKSIKEALEDCKNRTIQEEF